MAKKNTDLTEFISKGGKIKKCPTTRARGSMIWKSLDGGRIKAVTKVREWNPDRSNKLRWGMLEMPEIPELPREQSSS